MTGIDNVTYWVTDGEINNKPKPTTREELKVVLQNIWDSLEQGKIDKAVLAFRKRLRACVQAEGGHFEHALN